IQGLIATNRWASRAQSVLVELEGWQTELLEAQSGLRGFVITSNASFLSSFDATRDRCVKHDGNLTQLLADNKARLDRLPKLRQLTDELLLFQVNVLRWSTTLGLESARAMISSGEGKRLMDEARSIIRTMETFERFTLEERVEASNVKARHALLTG